MDYKENFLIENVVQRWLSRAPILHRDLILEESPSLEGFKIPVDVALGDMGW